MFKLALLSCSLSCLNTCFVLGAQANEDSFKTKREYLRSQSPSVVGRAAIIDGCKKLILTNPNDPHAAEAMFHIGTLPEDDNAAANMRAQPAEAFEWFQKAAEAAPRGTKIWTRAKQFVGRRAAYYAKDRAG